MSSSNFRPDCALRSFRTAYLFVTSSQQNIVETTRFNDIFLHYGKSSNKLVTLPPQMTPKRENDCARAVEIFNRPGAFCG